MTYSDSWLIDKITIEVNRRFREYKSYELRIWARELGVIDE